MAKVMLNFSELSLDFDSVKTYGDLIVHLSLHSIPSSEVIYRVVVDGEDVTEDHEREIGAEPLEKLEIVEFYTRRIVDIAAEGLKTACELVPSIKLDVLDGAGEIRTGNFERGYGLIGDVAPYLGWYIELLTAIDRVFIAGGDDFLLNGANGHGNLASFEIIESVREQVVALAQAQQYGDHAAVADILEYELAPRLETWEAEVKTLLKRMTEMQATA